MENSSSGKFIFKGHNALIVNYLFQVLLVTYLILLLIEQISPKFVSQYINLNYLLIVVIIAGILDVFSEHSTNSVSKKKPDWKDYTFIIILGILGFAIIKFKTGSLDSSAFALAPWLSWLISGIAGILIILLSFLILNDDKEDSNHKEIFHVHSKEKSIKRVFVLSVFAIIILFILSLIIPLFTSLSFIDSFRIVFGSVYVLFLPGFVLTFAFFPVGRNDRNEIDWLERIALSFALSIAVVPLAVFYLNLIGVKINLLNSFLTILGIIVLSLVFVFLRIKRN